MKITILGAGAWGTALAISLSARHRVTLWTRDATQIETMRASRCNQRYLPKIPLPQEINLTADLHAACTHAEFILLAVPIAALRATLLKIVQASEPVPVIWACKGFEADSAQLPHQVVAPTRH